MSELSAKELELLKRKQERTLQLRAEFIKQSTNPHRHMLGEGGTVFDTGLARFQAMRVSNYEHFKPTRRTFTGGLFAVVLPIAGFAYLLKWERDRREHKYRTGQVAYKDRDFKFV